MGQKSNLKNNEVVSPWHRSPYINFTRNFATTDRNCEDTFIYGVAEDAKIYDATAYRIKDVIVEPKNILELIYDYGDNWHVDITLEEIIVDKALPGKELPRVLDGAGYGIIEDCGGVQGLEDIAKVLKKKKGRQYREYNDFYGTDLDLTKFDLDDANSRLKKCLGFTPIFMRTI